MRQKLLVPTLLLALAAFSTAPFSLAQGAAAGDPATFRACFERYDAARHTLFLGSTEGVAREARALARQIEDLEAREDVSEEVRKLVPEIRERARTLASAKDLQAARSALSELTQPLVRWRKLLPESMSQGELPSVVYCAMSQKAWLQEPDQKVENPYHGQEMARCGEVVLGGEGL